jgi:hypothetical protein
MKRKRQSRPDLANILSSLKDFQRDTVQYVFKRMYTDADSVSRFLIADEVGLGKTLVARGVIASAVDYLWDKNVKRIDVVYICSNQEIAQQNIDRLNITQDRTFQHASRATLLPITIHELKGNRLNFVSLTPGTSFNLSSQGGWVWERVVLYYLLRDAWQISNSTLGNILRHGVRKDIWRRRLHEFRRSQKIDRDLKKSFLEAVKSQPELRDRYEVLAVQIGARRVHVRDELQRAQSAFIRDLRRLLARSSLSALQPDLIILDEFQRFKYLLDEDNEFALLAQELFNYRDRTGRPAKVLLLSATPYKMYTLQHEDENHYEDFLRTASFLLSGQPGAVEGLKKDIGQYRKIFLEWRNLSGDHQRLMETKQNMESILRKVMVRTERLAASADRNGMLEETVGSENKLSPEDLVAFAHLDRVAQFLKVENQVEYWKSSAYPLNLMDEYKIKQQFHKVVKEASHHDLYELLENSEHYLLHWSDIQKYHRIDAGNARLRSLIEQSVGTGNWKLLWLPPSLPYYQPEGPYKGLSPYGLTKTLIFSSWQIVPKMIAALLSFEAEREIMGLEKRDFPYDELLQERKPLLRFSISRGRLENLSNFTLLYPCLTLARDFDPLQLALSANSELSSAELLKMIRERLQERWNKALQSIALLRGGRVDERWYWYAPIILDHAFYRKEVKSWLLNSNKSVDWRLMLAANSKEDNTDQSAFTEHVRNIEDTFAFATELELGRPPDDLLDVLALMAVASPAVTALRSILRITGANKVSPEALAAAAQAGMGFRSLFNQPDAISLLQSLAKSYPKSDQVYWRAILTYCMHGNLQAVLDEYVHILRESLGIMGHTPEAASLKLGSTLRQALSIRSPNLRVDEIKLHRTTRSVSIHEHSLRCRYAMRFGGEKLTTLEDGTRDTEVRVAFNSPFRPFVLASTSVGQEGLDFHQYCHRVMHWNLPANPVDLEQREGRVHRYKGHVIRRNLAHCYSFRSIKPNDQQLIDPWDTLFELAREGRSTSSELEPYWIFDKGPYRIERQLPILPLSREVDRIKQLKDALVAYRSVIGQPRQQELMETLMARLSPEDLKNMANEFSINLNPPKSIDKSEQRFVE